MIKWIKEILGYETEEENNQYGTEGYNGFWRGGEGMIVIMNIYE